MKFCLTCGTDIPEGGPDVCPWCDDKPIHLGTFVEVATFDRVKAELSAAKALLGECLEIGKAALKLTLAASDWAIRYEIESLNDEALGVNAMFFKDEIDLIPRIEKALGKEEK